MRLTGAEAMARLTAGDHGVLATVHSERGADAVPVVYCARRGHVAVPVDRVKPKSSIRLQRERNLERDPRATLLVDHWDRDDWTTLWWVRAELRSEPASDLEGEFSRELAARFEQYRDQPFERLLVFRVIAVSGWSGAG